MRCRRGWIVLLGLVVGIGCSDPEGEPIVLNQDQDVGVDVGADVAPQPDAVTEPDAEPDVDAGEDTDTPGGPVDGEGDNCPDISNPDQSDRSRDGVGDACAHFPYYHDPTNPESVPIIEEEGGPPNDTFTDAIDHWMLDLPLMLEGTVSAPTGDANGDVDHYAIEIEEPTTLLVHLEALSSSIWPVLIIVGDTSDDVEYQSVVWGPNRGESEVRDVHLPVPGRYVFAVSDLENVSASGTPTGGPDYEYRVSLSTPPLPQAESVPVPTPRQVVSYERREATVFSVDVSGEDALKVEATGAPRNAVSVLFPAIHFLDGDTGNVLAYTLEEQVNTDSLRNEMTMKLGDEVDTVHVLVEGHTSLGDNDLVVDIDLFDKPEHLASVEDPRESRESHLLWMRPGSQIESEIGPPRPASDTFLEADQDYFMFLSRPGDFVRIVAEPLEGSMLIPEVSIGELWNSWIWGWHWGYGADDTGESASMSVLMTEERRRDFAIEVVHRDNAATNLPVGGPLYRYELRVESVDIDEIAERYESFPATVPVGIEAGETQVYEFPFEVGYGYQLDVAGPLSIPVDIIDKNSWETLVSTTGSASFVNLPGEDLVVAIRDRSGIGIVEQTGMEFELLEGDGPQDVSVPDVVEGSLDDDRPQQVYRFSATADQLVDIRAVSPEGVPPAVEVVGEAFDVLSSDRESRTTISVAEDGEFLAIVSRSTPVEVDYTLGLQQVELEEVTAPQQVIDTIDDEMSTRWWRVAVDEGQSYVLNALGEQSDEALMWMAVYDGISREKLAESDQGFGYFQAHDTEEVWVAVADPRGPLTPPVELGLSLAAVEPIDLDETGTTTVDLVDGIRPAVVRFHHESSGLSTVDVEPDGQRDVSAILGTSLYEIFDGQAPHSSFTAMARTGERQWTGAIVPRDIDDQTGSADVTVTDMKATEAVVLAEDQATFEQPLMIESWPAIYQGELGWANAPRVFSAELEQGDSLWAVTMPPPQSFGSSLNTRLALIGPDGITRESDAGSGEGNYSILADAQVDEDGLWEVELQFQGGLTDDFIIYFLRR